MPEQSWILPNGDEVLVNARISRPRPHAPVEHVAVSLRSGRGRARLDRERSDLVATVAHELRSPLTGVKGFVQAMLNRWDLLSDEQKKLMLATVNADADRLARLIAELLDVARIDTGRLSLYPREVDGAMLVRRVVDSVQAAHLAPPGARGRRRPGGDLRRPRQVHPGGHQPGGERRAARRGHRPGGCWGEVADAAGRPGASLVVTDEGEGIPEDLRRRVLTKFWTSGAAGGSGLGMYIAHGLTRAHGGQLSIDDRPGGGARITVEWPVEDRRPD